VIDMAVAREKPVLLLKKLGALALLLIGFLLAALGYHDRSTGLTIIGIVLIAAGLALWALKIIRRNQRGQL
jgi:hypothetical protein